MAVLEEALVARAKTISGFYSLIGGATSPRFHAVELPEHPTLPAAEYRRVSRVHFPLSGADSTLKAARMQVTCWGATYASAKGLAAQAVLAFGRGFSGSFAGVTVNEAFVQNETDVGWDAVGEKFGVSVDTIVWYQE
jgi:hypothetical protein